jgi:hypothetical protein
MKIFWFWSALIFNTLIVAMLLSLLPYGWKYYSFLITGISIVVAIGVLMKTENPNHKQQAKAALWDSIISIPLAYVACFVLIVASGKMC